MKKVYTYSGWGDRFSFWEDPEDNRIVIKDSVTDHILPRSYATCNEALAFLDGFGGLQSYGLDFLKPKEWVAGVRWGGTQ